MAAQPRPHSHPGSRQGGAAPMSGCVLVVDDDAGMRQLLAVSVGRLGQVALSAGSVQEALRLLNTWSITAVVSDYQMPSETGLDLLAAVHMRWPEIPFVLTSASLPDDVADAARALGAAVVPKGTVVDALPELLSPGAPARSRRSGARIEPLTPPRHSSCAPGV